MSIQIFKRRTVIMLILSITALLILVGIWYKHTYSMDVAEHIEHNSSYYSQKLLIATQGSEFKNALTEEVIANYKNDSIYINVIDVTALDKINLNNYNAILLLHTWENWKPPVAVEKFVNGLSEIQKNKLVVMTTSGQGTYKMDEVDAITGESEIKNMTSISNQIIEKLNPLLKTENTIN